MPKFYQERLYYVWRSMKERCNNWLSYNAKNYHDRGIRVCREWESGYQAGYFAFREWALSNGYEPGLFLDRVDNDKGYNPENCRWVTPTESALHRRDIESYRMEAFGEAKSLREWSRDPRCQISYSGLRTRLKRYNMTLEDALILPSMRSY